MKYQQNNQNQQDRIKQLLKQFCDYYDIKKQQTVINNPRYQKHNYNDTFAIYLEQHDIPTPKEFQYDPEYIIEYDKTTAMKIAEKGKIPSEYWNHDPSLKDILKNTVAIYLASNGIVPPKQWEHNPNIKNKYGFTVQDYLQSNNIKVPKQWQIINCDVEYKKLIKYLIDYCKQYKIDKDTIINNPSWQDNKNKQTFAFYLVFNNIIPPKQFQYDPNIKCSLIKETIDCHLLFKQLPVPNEWYGDRYKQQCEYKPEYVNNAFYGIITNKPDNVKSEQQYENGWTVAMIYASQGIIPPECWNHDPKLINNEGDTVAILLAEQKVIPPKQWQHKPELQNQWGSTVALNLSKNGIIPPKEWSHDPYIPSYDEMTVQDYLIENNIDVPQQWKFEDKQIEMTDEIKQKLEEYCKQHSINNQQLIINYPKYQKHFLGGTFAVFLQLFDIEIPKEFLYDPSYVLRNGNTTAMSMIQCRKIPPKYWQHDKYFKNNEGFTVQDYFIKNDMQVPEEWKIEDKQIKMTSEIQQQLNEFCKQYNINDQQLIIKNPQYQNLPWDNTFAMFLASKGIIPPKEFYHDPRQLGNRALTVQDYLQINGKQVPQCWKIRQITYFMQQQLRNYCAQYNINDRIILQNPNWQNNKNRQTFPMYLAQRRILSPDQFNHDPKIQDKNGDTVAIYLEMNNIEIPNQWQYDPLYRLEYNFTTAMKIAFHGKIPSNYWQHDLLLKDDYGSTVAMFLSSKGIIPPQQWMHDIDISNNDGEYSIKQNLLSYGYIYINNQFIKLTQDNVKQRIQLETLNDTCQICLNEGKQQFIKSTCNHRICLQCFKELIKSNSFEKCPVCRQFDWLRYVDQNQK